MIATARPASRRVFFHAFGGRFGDHRDWPVIDAWAERIARWLPTAAVSRA